jgi:hypothetical protein
LTVPDIALMFEDDVCDDLGCCWVQLGGYNSPLSLETADFLGTSTIIFGMDVSHPGSLGDVDSPSIAAVSISRIKQIVKKILGCVNCAESY